MNDMTLETERGTDQRDSGADFDNLKQSFSQLRSDINQLLHSAAGAGRSGAHAVADQVKDRAARAKDEASRHITDLSTKAKRAAGAIEDRINDRPVTSTIVGFGLGYIVARMMMRR